MKQGFVKVAAVTPDIRVADVEFNKEQSVWSEDYRISGALRDRLYM